jgi:hypothetical protein
MEKLIPSFTNVTLWQKKNFVNTGGTRSKFISLNDKEEIFISKAQRKLLMEV